VGILYGDTIISFDPTVSWGTIISIVTMVATVIVAYTRIVATVTRRLDRIETKLNILWSSWRRGRGADRQSDEEFFNGKE